MADDLPKLLYSHTRNVHFGMSSVAGHMIHSRSEMLSKLTTMATKLGMKIGKNRKWSNM